MSESSERELGKRERKKKEFPEFIYTEDSYKVLCKQTAETIASTTRVRRKSGKPTGCGFLSHDQAVMKAKGIAKQKGARHIKNAQFQANSDPRNGKFPRKLPAPTPATPEPSNKRARWVPRCSLVGELNMYFVYCCLYHFLCMRRIIPLSASFL